MIHTDLSPRLHHSSLAAAALAAAAAEGQSPTSIVSMPQSSFPQKTPFAIQELLGLGNDHSESNELKSHGGSSGSEIDNKFKPSITTNLLRNFNLKTVLLNFSKYSVCMLSVTHFLF